MNLSAFRRDCENRNNSDDQIKAIIMLALRDGKNTETVRDDLLAILKEHRPFVHGAVCKSLARHAQRYR